MPRSRPSLGIALCLALAGASGNAGRPATLINGTPSPWLICLLGEKPKQGRVAFTRLDPVTGQAKGTVRIELDEWFSAAISLAAGGRIQISCEDAKTGKLSLPMALVGTGLLQRERYGFLYQENSAQGDALLVPNGESRGSARWDPMARGVLRLEGVAAEGDQEPEPAPGEKALSPCAIL
jgi:hypothetical protein